MIRALILTWWTATVTAVGPAVVLHVARAYPGGRYSDVTGQPSVPTSPNAVVVEVEMPAADFAALAEDPEYAGSVLWEETL